MHHLLYMHNPSSEKNEFGYLQISQKRSDLSGPLRHCRPQCGSVIAPRVIKGELSLEFCFQKHICCLIIPISDSLTEWNILEQHSSGLERE